MPKRKKPNILMVITHDTGRHLGCYGRGVDTPHLDRLAAEGVRFTRAFCAAPQCSPSRASLLSGLMPHRHGLIGLTHRGFQLNRGVPLLPALLQRAGYATFLFGYQHEVSLDRKLGYRQLGYQRLGRPADGNLSCANVTPLVLDFLERSPPQPFFVMVGVKETHRPFPPADSPLDTVKVPSFLPDAPEVRRDVARLNEAVRRVDQSVGAIMAALEKNHLSDNTLLIYTTDHGIAFPGAKATLFDPGIETALLMRGPGEFEGGKIIEALVSNTDVAPTLLEWCGASLPGNLDGQSLLPLARGDASRIHDQLFCELTYHAAYDPMRGLRTEKFKYIRSFEKRPWWLAPNTDGGPEGYAKEWFRAHRPEMFQKPRPSELLYDLSNDPLEQQNLADHPRHGGTLAVLHKKLEQWMRATGDPLLRGPVPLPKGAKLTPVDSWDP
ncbi:MAG: sulfatase [Verrucomicrobia bacterium]|nr:sulfatase [Verrucomicrobiota bacterium]